MKRIDYTGKRFGMLTVIRHTGTTGAPRHEGLWECKCDCGNTHTLKSEMLRTEKAKSCGCYYRRAGGDANNRNGGRTTEYSTLRSMIQRCHDTNHKNYPPYGGKGITVCDEWRGPFGYKQFLKDMGRRPAGDFSLDRISPWGNYEPDNCRWATRKTQRANQKTPLIAKAALKILEQHGLLQELKTELELLTTP